MSRATWLIFVLWCQYSSGVSCSSPGSLQHGGHGRPTRLARARVPLHRVDHGGLGLRRRWETKRKQLIAISGAKDFSYYTVVNVGGQPFNVALDTGSADLWIQSQNCSASECSGAPQYTGSPTLSTSPLAFTVDYLSGEVLGQVATDTVRLAQYEIASQVFGLANDLRNMTFSQMGISGMLGLGFPAIASISPERGLPVIFNIAFGLETQEQFFSFRLGRDVGSNLGNSTFNIGQHDPIVTDPAALQYMPVYPKSLSASIYDFWKVPFDGIIVNGSPIKLGSSKLSSSKAPIAVFDTGTSLILGPTSDIDAIYGALHTGNPSKNAAGQWTVDCLLAIDLLVIMGGRAYPIHPLDLSWDKISDGHGRCYGGFQANDDVVSGDYLFGDTAMRNIYTAHYFETAHAPPLLALLSMTTPSTSLRDFIIARGTGYVSDPGATFSDDVLRVTYPSAYSPTATLQHDTLDNSTTPDRVPLNYYDSKQVKGKASGEVLRAMLILLASMLCGFGIGGVGSVLMRLSGKDFGQLLGGFRKKDVEGDKTRLLGDMVGPVDTLTRREGRKTREQLRASRSGMM